MTDHKPDDHPYHDALARMIETAREVFERAATTDQDAAAAAREIHRNLNALAGDDPVLAAIAMGVGYGYFAGRDHEFRLLDSLKGIDANQPDVK